MRKMKKTWRQAQKNVDSEFCDNYINWGKEVTSAMATKKAAAKKTTAKKTAKKTTKKK
jgi:hypothetical protein